MTLIEEHLDKILQEYTEGDYYIHLKESKQKFIDITGSLNEEDSDYESRMNSFNEWFIFNYRRTDGRRVIDDYIQDHQIEPKLAKALFNVNYSLFQFSKINFKKQVVIKDILHNEKFVLSKDNHRIALVEQDIFLGRMVNFEGENFLLRGICTLPNEVLSSLKKQAKKIKKLKNQIEEEKFLLKLEALKTKSKNYGHIDANKIFVFT
jgi:hypothetical protein